MDLLVFIKIYTKMLDPATKNVLENFRCPQNLEALFGRVNISW
jgi:hypothetical protein